MTKDQAKEQLANASRREIAGLAGDAAKIAKDQITAKNTFQDLVSRTVTAGGFEGGTEMLQEATAYQ